MSWKQIAIRLGMSEYQVRRLYERAINRLLRRNDCSIVLKTLYACADEDEPQVLRARSAECNREFVAMYMHRRGGK